MMEKKRCISCMQVIAQSTKVCPYCGFQEEYYQEELYFLPAGSTLQGGRYQIGRTIGEGGFGLTYIGWDNKFSHVVAVKEFFMKQTVSRLKTESYEIRLYNQYDSDQYEKDKERVRREAKILKRYAKYQGIVSVEDYFDENNTVYIVMEYIRGITLGRYMKSNRYGFDAQSFLALFRPLIESLYRIHRTGIQHRDISLDNIMLEESRSLTLVDFGSARPAENVTLVTVKNGYAPPEQYLPDEKYQGPWIDVYAICVCLYNCITGKRMADSRERVQKVQEDNLWENQEKSLELTDRQKKTLEKGLELDFTKRLQSMSELYEGLYGKKLIVDPEPKPTPPKRWTVVINILKAHAKTLSIVCGLAVVLVMGVFLGKMSGTVDKYGNETEWEDAVGNIYKGVRKNGLIDGIGICYYHDGSRYEGAFAEGKREGIGTLTYSDGSIYEGNWKDGKKEGKGTLTYSDGSCYEGEWEDNKRNGDGTYTWANDDRYEGEWKNDAVDGLGTAKWETGERYEGEWKDNKQNGTGTQKYADGASYEGEWKNGVKEGKGVWTYQGGNYYQGAWKADLPDGEGMFCWTNGNYYKGIWKNNRREGEGTFYWSKNGEYQDWWAEVNYKNDVLDGERILHKPNGETIVEKWSNGVKLN